MGGEAIVFSWEINVVVNDSRCGKLPFGLNVDEQVGREEGVESHGIPAKRPVLLSYKPFPRAP